MVSVWIKPITSNDLRVIGPSSDLENRLETHNTGCDGKAYFFFLLEMAHERSDQGSERP